MTSIGRPLELVWTALLAQACGGVLVEPTAEVRLGERESFVATSDVTLEEGAPNRGSTAKCLARGGTKTPKFSCLMRFSLPEATVTVKSAWLELHVFNASPHTFDVYPVLESWSEADTTWVERAPEVPWQTPGAKGSVDRGPSLGQLAVRGRRAKLVFDAAGRALVQAWLENPSAHRGIVIAGDANENGIGIASREHPKAAHHPRLVIETGR